MKKAIVLFIVLLTGLGTARAINASEVAPVILSEPNCEIKVYASFDALKRSEATYIFRAVIPKVRVTSGYRWTGGTHDYYRPITAGEGIPEINKAYAIHDGKDLYISLKHKRAKKRTKLFSKVTVASNWGYFHHLKAVPSAWREPQVPDRPPTGDWHQETWKYAINLETGEVMELNRRSLKKLLAETPALLAEFKAEKRKGKKLKTYLLRYANQVAKTK